MTGASALSIRGGCRQKNNSSCVIVPVLEVQLEVTTACVWQHPWAPSFIVMPLCTKVLNSNCYRSRAPKHQLPVWLVLMMILFFQPTWHIFAFVKNILCKQSLVFQLLCPSPLFPFDPPPPFFLLWGKKWMGKTKQTKIMFVFILMKLWKYCVKVAFFPPKKIYIVF